MFPGSQRNTKNYNSFLKEQSILGTNHQVRSFQTLIFSTKFRLVLGFSGIYLNRGFFPLRKGLDDVKLQWFLQTRIGQIQIRLKLLLFFLKVLWPGLCLEARVSLLAQDVWGSDPGRAPKVIITWLKNHDQTGEIRFKTKHIFITKIQVHWWTRTLSTSVPVHECPCSQCPWLPGSLSTSVLIYWCPRPLGSLSTNVHVHQVWWSAETNIELFDTKTGSLLSSTAV